jgi:hypothetical protein
MLSDNNLKAVCPVTEMARKVGLSRARFYQLQKTGVFPEPLRSGPKRPFYPLELQRKCIEIRETGIGFNGQPVIFYSSRKDRSQSRLSYERLADALRQMNLNVTLDTVKKAVEALYPKGLPSEGDEGRVIRDLFRYFERGV